MVERVDGTVDGLMEQQIVEIGIATFKADHSEPYTTENGQGQPCSDAPVAEELTDAAREEQKHCRGYQRNEYAVRSLGKHSQKQVHRKQPSIGLARFLLIKHFPEGMQCHDDEEGHEHIHAQYKRSADEEAARQQQDGGGFESSFPALLAGPAVQPVHDADGGKHGEQGQQPHPVRSREPFAQHHQPQIEWRLVGIGHAVIVEGEEGVVAQCFIGYAEIAQLVRGGEVP